MKKKLLLFITLLIICSLSLVSGILFSQPQQSWVARYEGPNHYQDNPTSIVSDAVGNVYVTGTTDLGTIGIPPYPFPINVITIKYSPSGVQQWVVTYSSSGFPATSYDRVSKIALDNIGNIYITGFSFRNNGTISDMFMIKYNQEGSQQWIKKILGNDTISYW